MVTIGTPRIAGSTRWHPGQSRDLTAARNENLVALREKFTPVPDPVAEIVKRIEFRSPIQPLSDIPGIAQSGYESDRYRAELQPADVPRNMGGGLVGRHLMEQVRSGALPSVPGAGQIRSIKNQTGFINSFAAGSYEVDPHGQARIEVDPELPVLKKAEVLAHEMGHHQLGHEGNYSYLPTEMQEAEAQTVAYGVMNKMFPWQQRIANETADYAIASQLKNTLMEEINGPSLNANPVNPAAYLSEPSVNQRINQAVNELVPVARQPFKQIIPAVYQPVQKYAGYSVDPREVVNPLAYGQEEFINQQMLNDRYGRYGY